MFTMDYIIFIVVQSWSAKRKKKKKEIYNGEKKRYSLFDIFLKYILNDQSYSIIKYYETSNNNIPLKMMKRNGKTCWWVTFYGDK